MINHKNKNMYQVIIVEDEQDVRERITKFVSKRSDVFNIVGIYVNGADALEGIINLEPDILITDIKIPYLEGMELISEAINYVPYLKSIVITGFDVFEYAKRAVELDVVGFLTKPIIEESLNHNLDKAIIKIEDEKSLIKNVEVINELKKENNFLIKESLFQKILRENSLSDNIIKRLSNNDISLDFKYFQIANFMLNELNSDLEIEAYLIQIYQEIEALINVDVELNMTIKNEQLIILIKSNQEINVEKHFQNVISKHNRFYNNILSVGLSLVFSNYYFKEAYDQAKTALTYRSFFTNKYNVYRYLEEGNSFSFKYNIELTRELRYTLEYLTLSESKNILDKLISESFLSHNQNVHYLVISNILNEIFKSVKNINRFVNKIGNINDYYLQFLNMHSKEQLLNKLYELLELISEINHEERQDLSSVNTNKILRLIQDNYKNPDFSLEILADEVNLSVSYISLLLKEQNLSFVKYLTNLRIVEAKKLLTNSSLKIIEIAEEVGYLDPYYFSHVFKKQTGISPRKYRNDHEKV